MNNEYPLALPLGTVLAGQYQIGGILGQGGFGITYRAADLKSGNKVAIKEFFPDSLAARTGGTSVSAFSGDRTESFEYGKSCFLKEAETLAQFIGNENIVRVISYFEENGTAYFVMEFIEGLSFDDYIKQRGGRISYEEASRVLVPIMEALEDVHRRGIIHRDVTPDNIFITNDGIPKLIDFGAARYSLGDKSQSLDVVLKHGFAPKEQYTRRGRQGPYTDIYSLGASFYYAVTGKRPPDAIERMEEDNLVAPSARGVHIPYEAEEAILKALNLQPTERFQSMEEFERALLGPKTLTRKTSQGKTEEICLTGAADIDRTVAVKRGTARGARKDRTGRARRRGMNPAVIIAVVLALVLVLAAGVTFAVRLLSNTGMKAQESADNTGEDKAEDREEATDGGLTEDSVTEDAGDEITEETEDKVDLSELSDEDLKYPEIIGNTSNNLMNYCLVGMNGEYYKGSTYPNACYSRIGDDVFYLKNIGGEELQACRKNEITGEDEPIPELKRFSKISRLLVSKAYYYVFVRNENSLYCVSRVDGEIKNSRSIEDPRLCSFYEGWFYFVGDNDDGGQSIYRVPAGELDDEAEEVVSLAGGSSITLICSAPEGIVYRETGNEVALSLFTAKYLDEGNAYIQRYAFDYRDYNGGKVREINAVGTDIYFGGFIETDYSWDIGKFDTLTGETTILTNIYSTYYIDLTVFEEEGKDRIAYYSYPKSSSKGDPFLGYMDTDGNNRQRTDLNRHD